MLRISWIYTIHNLVITYLTLGIIKQLFLIKSKIKQIVFYVLWMQMVFIFNDFVIEVNFPLQYKYIMLFFGFSFGFKYILKLSFVASTLVMIVNLTVNGIATNLNIFALLLNQFDSYGIALEHDFIQYSSLVMMTTMLYLMLKTFNVRILEISKYD